MEKSGTSKSDPLEIKTILVGSTSVGKTSILQRYVENVFSPVVATIGTNLNFHNPKGVDFKTRDLKISDMDVKLQLWDTTGQERFRSMAKNFFRGAKGAFFVLDLTDKASVDITKTWITQCNSHAGEDIVKMVLANKADLVEQRAVPIEEIMTLASDCSAKFYEVSAKTGQNINEAFGDMAEEIVKKIVMKKNKKGDRGFSLLDKSQVKNDEKAKQKACCGS